MAKLLKKGHTFQQKLKENQESLRHLKKRLALEEEKLQSSLALVKKEKIAQERVLVAKRKEEEERLKKVAEEKARIEEERLLVLAQQNEEERLKKAAEEKARLEEERLLLLKQQEAIYSAKKEEEERQRLAALKKKQQEAERKRLDRLKKQKEEEEERQRLARLEEKKRQEQEVIELEKLDLFESDQIGEELALFNEEKTRIKKSGFKDLEDWFKVSVAYSTAVKNIDEQDYGREALKTTITINPHSYYFLGMTSSLDLNRYKSPYYQPDFSYSFGYSDWHMDTFSWNYSNYANNKFNPRDGESRFNFGKGNWELSYKTKTDDITWTAKGKYVTDTDTKKLYLKAKTVLFDDVMVSAQWKHNINKNQNRLTLSAKTFLYEKFFVSGSIYEYFKSDTIGSNDGEYAYSFGWKDSRPFYPSIIYSNYYTPTRWDEDEGPKFHDGTLSIKFNLDF